ncbi:MAG TPA: zinc-binding dehydrogenase [Solirubrobacterales bacterium]|nr:zinc-binding dehydrogenase [Solirubrobacterales bacterium]
MEAAVLKQYGAEPEFGEFEEPSPNGLALVEVAVAGINPVDHTIASGHFPGREPPLPSVPGLEGVGTSEGRRVYFDSPVAPFGSMGERTLVDPEELIDVPDGVEDGLAVSFGISGLAAWLALTWRAELREGESVLVLGSSGVLGQIAVQGARLLGAGRVVAAARDAQSLERAREELGADAVVELGGEGDLSERFKQASGGGFDVVVDPLWGEPAVAALGALNVEGRLIQIGNSAGESIELPTRGFRNQLGRIIGHTNFKASRELKREAFTAMCEHALAGELTVETEGVPLRDVGEAWNRKSPHRKLVIEVSASAVPAGADGSSGIAAAAEGAGIPVSAESADASAGDADVQEEADAAAAEAARIGGEVTPLSDDPAREPLEEAGEGEAEGFEQAERALQDIASHGDQHRFPGSVAPPPEEPESIERGEADQAIPPDE